MEHNPRPIHQGEPSTIRKILTYGFLGIITLILISVGLLAVINTSSTEMSSGSVDSTSSANHTPATEIVTIAPSDGELKWAVGESYSKPLIKRAELEGRRAVIELKGTDQYLKDDNNFYRVFAVEPARIFNKLPDLESMRIIAPFNNKKTYLGINRQQIQDHYNLDFRTLTIDQFEAQFVKKYTNDDYQKFLDRFIISD